MEDHISDVEEVSVVEFDPEVAIAEIYAVKVWEQMMAERFAEEAKDVAVVQNILLKRTIYSERSQKSYFLATSFSASRMHDELFSIHRISEPLHRIASKLT